MPKEKSLTKLIPNIYKKNVENLGLFFYVKAQKQIIPTVTLEQSILSYFRFADIDIDEWDLESAKTTYNRLQKEYYRDCKS
jgi:hypothetical protein